MSINLLGRRKKSWIGIIFLGCIIALSIIFLVCERSRATRPVIPELSNQLVSYSSQIAKLTMLYPKNLIGKDLPQGNQGDKDIKIVITDYTSSPYIEVAHRLAPNGNLGDVINWGDERNRSKNDYSDILVKEFNTSGYYGKSYSGAIREYFKSGGPFFKKIYYHCFDWYNYNNQTEYIFSFCIDQQNWQYGSVLFAQMIDSIQFK